MRKIQTPFKGKYPITQNFGVEASYMRCGYHTGIDWAVPNGTELLAVCDGEIIVCEKWKLTGYGREVQIKRKQDGVIMQYAHMSEVYVSKGQQIEEGTIIGKSGNSGFWISLSKGKGYHLHFGTMINGEWFNPKKILEDFNIGEEVEKVEKEKKEKVKESETIKIPVKNEDYDEYVVQKKDTLWKISECFYGVGKRWKEIYAYNKDTIKDPAKIKVGMVIKIPKK